MTTFGDHLKTHEFEVFCIEHAVAIQIQHHIRRHTFHYRDKETRGRQLTFNPKRIFSTNDPGSPNFRMGGGTIGHSNNIEQV